MSSHSLEKTEDKPEQDRDPLPHYYNPMAKPDSTYFFQSTDGRFIFPFEDGEEKHLVSVDETIDAKLPALADKIEAMARRVWREVFAALRIATVFLFVFIVELVRFICHDIIHAFVLRLLSIIGDFIIKPLLVLIYNCLMLPFLIFTWNVLTGVQRALEPACGILKNCMLQFVPLLRAFRIVEVTYGRKAGEGSDGSKIESV